MAAFFGRYAAPNRRPTHPLLEPGKFRKTGKDLALGRGSVEVLAVLERLAALKTTESATAAFQRACFLADSSSNCCC